jgi:hypothetical protein
MAASYYVDNRKVAHNERLIFVEIFSAVIGLLDVNKLGGVLSRQVGAVAFAPCGFRGVFTVFFLENQCYGPIFAKAHVQIMLYFRHFLKIHNIVPRALWQRRYAVCPSL